MKKILFAASESVPFIKTGGLADVAGALPKCFDKRYFDVRVILPKYACMKQEWKDKMEYITHFYMDLGYKNCYVGIMHMEYEGIQFYLSIMNIISVDRSHMTVPHGILKICILLKGCIVCPSGYRFPPGCDPLSRLADRSCSGISA